MFSLGKYLGRNINIDFSKLIFVALERQKKRDVKNLTEIQIPNFTLRR